MTDSAVASPASREVKVFDLDLTHREVLASYFISAVFDEFVRLIEHHFRNLKLFFLIKINIFLHKRVIQNYTMLVNDTLELVGK